MKNHPNTYWYFVTLKYCPVCGSERIYRERVYTPKPEAWEDRHKVEDLYDWCLEWEGLGR